MPRNGLTHTARPILRRVPPQVGVQERDLRVVQGQLSPQHSAFANRPLVLV
jgi:hypothetical protein